MSSLTANVSPLRQRMIDDMRMRKLDGKTHKVEVKVKKPGLKVRARKHYVASK